MRFITPAIICTLFLFAAALSGCTKKIWLDNLPPTRMGRLDPIDNATAAAISLPDLNRIDNAVIESIRDENIPGAVVVVGYRGKVVFARAYGYRSIVPMHRAMKPDTLFDVASLTKVVALAPSVMKLYEQGKLDIDDPVSKYLPDFAQNGKGAVTIKQLLTHTSCMPFSDDLAQYERGKERALEYIYQLKLKCEPGSRFIYSGIGYIVLAEVVDRVSGERLDRFSREHIFKPLGMRKTRFNPGWFQKIGAAPTEFRDGRWLQGSVEDSRAEYLGGVSGHAGLFSTAGDLAIFSEMMLARGAYNGKRIFKPQTIEEMTKPQTPKDMSAVRGLGWDIQTEYSSPRGDYFPPGSYGHTGFTGTSMWLDPQSQTFVIILTNRVHPLGSKSRGINPLRREIANIVATAVYLR